MSLSLAHLIKPEIEEMIVKGDVLGLRAACEDLHGADLVAILVAFEPVQRNSIFEALALPQQKEVFEYLAIELQRELLEGLRSDTRKAVLNALPPDDRAKLFEQLPEELTKQLLAELAPDERQYTLDLLKHEEATAGRIMTPEYLWVNVKDTVAEAFTELRAEAPNVETIYVIYVIDEGGKLAGTISLRELLMAKPETKVADMMTPNSVHSLVSTPQEDVANTMKHYDLLAIPVLDDAGKMLGIITFDDVHDVLVGEASKDILRMSGVAASTDEYFDAPVHQKLKRRLIVLFSLAGVSCGSVLLQEFYNGMVLQVSILAVFLTLLAGSSGNCGTQIAGIVIRAQAVQDIDRARFIRLLSREVIVGILMALVMALAAVGLVFVQGGDPKTLGGHQVWQIASVVGIAMFSALATINLLGGFIPVLLKKMHIDPAIAAGPFITTTADIMTVAIYFNVAGMILHI